jgi:Mrp family chromosome partitioning ATPase
VSAAPATPPLGALGAYLAVVDSLAEGPWDGGIIGVVSPHRGDGRSTVAAGLALTLARETEGPVLLVDLDVERPAQATRFGAAPEPGLRDCVDAPRRLRPAAVQVGRRLWLVPTGGGTPMESLRALEGVAGSGLLDECRASFTWTVLDLPPFLDTPSAVAPVVTGSDCCVLVGRHRGTRVDALTRTAALLARPVVGFALTADRSRVPAWISRCLGAVPAAGRPPRA